MALSKYNKDRPFLVVNLIRMAPKKAPTHQKDYGTTGQWQIGEQITIEDCIKSKHLFEAAMIVDILKTKVIKNRTEKTNEEVLQYLLKKYKKEITEGIQIWMRKNNMTITTQQIQKMEKNADVPNIVQLVLDENTDVDITNMIADTVSTTENIMKKEKKKNKPKTKKKKDSEPIYAVAYESNKDEI